MIVSLIINGVEADISAGIPLQVVSVDNLGASAATRITERSPAQDGDTDIDRRLEPRIIPIIMQARPNEIYTLRACRRLINEMFKATRVPVILRITFDTGEVYQIDTQSIGDVSLPLNLSTTNFIRVGVTLRAANPTFYNPHLAIFNYALGASSGAFLVPTPVPTTLGGSTIAQSNTIAYDGTYRTLPVITAYGPLTNLVIRNTTTGAKIDFTGFTIANGDYYTIDLRSGRKLIYRNDNINDSRLNEVTADSNLAAFAIEAAPDVLNGDNTITIDATGATNVSQVYLQFYRRFDGI